jgi:hypothetical protein
MQPIFDAPVLPSSFQVEFGIAFQARDVETSFDDFFSIDNA